MAYVKWTFIAILVLLVGAFLHYTLPRHDVVRITDTRERQITVGDNALFWGNEGAGNAEGGTQRFVNFIEGFTPKNKPMVYRNEDTGWGWPPYFKFDTSNLQAKAGDLVSSKGAPEWVMVTRYGWRNEYLSIYPNAVEIRPVEGPDVTIIPWFNIVFLTALGLLALWIWRLLARFRENRIEPMLEDMGDSFEAVGDRAEGFWRRLLGR